MTPVGVGVIEMRRVGGGSPLKNEQYDGELPLQGLSAGSKVAL
jgi:hypothetical protein